MDFMARRRKDYADSDLIEVIVILSGLIVLLRFISSQVRNFVAALGQFAVLPPSAIWFSIRK